MISPYASPTKYGWHSRSYTIGKELANRGHEVTVFAFLGNQYLRLLPENERLNLNLVNSIETHEGVRFHWFKGIDKRTTHPVVRILNWKFYNRQFRKWLRKGQQQPPDVVIVSSPSVTPGFLIKDVKRKFPAARIVFEVRDIWPLSLQQLGNYSSTNPVMKWLKKAECVAVNQSDAIVGLMPGIHNYLNDHFKGKVDRKIITYLPHSVELDESHTTKDSNTTDEYFLGYAGTIGKANDIKTLVEALKLLKKEGMYPKTLIIGDGILQEDLAHSINSLPHITYEAWMPREKVLTKLKHCTICYDGFLDIPLYDYGFSRLKWVDYMLLKKPVLASFGGSAYELPIREMGWCIEPESPKLLADTIAGLFANPSKLEIEKKGVLGFQFLKTQRSTPVLVNAYERAIFGE